MMNQNRFFKNFGKTLKTLRYSGLTKQQIREGIVKNTDTEDLLRLLDIFEDMIEALQKGD